MKKCGFLRMVVVLSIGSILYASAKNLDECCEYLLDKQGCRISYRQVLTRLVGQAVEINDQEILRLINFDHTPKNIKLSHKTSLLNFEIEIRFGSLLSKCGFQYREPTREDERGMKEFQMMHDVVHGLYVVKRNISGYFYAQRIAEQERLAQQALERSSYFDLEPTTVTSANRQRNIGKGKGRHKKGSKTHRPSRYF